MEECLCVLHHIAGSHTDTETPPSDREENIFVNLTTCHLPAEIYLNNRGRNIYFYKMPNKRNRKLREAYEQYFTRDTREVTVNRIVNVIDKRAPLTRPEQEYDRGQNPGGWYGGPQNQQDTRPFCDDDPYPATERGYSDNVNYISFSSSPKYTEDYPGSQRDHEPLKRQVEIRNEERPGPYHVNRGRGIFPHNRPMHERGENMPRPLFSYADRGDHHEGYKRREPCTPGPEPSPMRRDAQAHMSARSGSKNNSRNHSPEKDKSQTYQMLQQMRYDMSHATYGRNNRDLDIMSTFNANSTTEEESLHSVKENPPLSAVKLEEVEVAASTQPTMTPEENFKARRAQAIKDKAMEIEESYRQDCVTFSTVVKMLVSKEPSLEQLLHAPLNRNLTEIKQRCLDDLKHFVEELDQVKPAEISIKSIDFTMTTLPV